MYPLNLKARLYLLIRSFLERTLAIVILLLLMPVLFFVSLIIFITMGRPIIFTQVRVGKNELPFKMYKFRSMNNVSVPGPNNETRITRFGRFMRKYRIDELIQFYNILKGDMSIIGPRPEPVNFAKKYNACIPNYRERHIIKPGITGLAQVEIGHVDSEEETKEKLSYDLWYIQNLSFWLDIKVILRTIKVVFTGYGAR